MHPEARWIVAIDDDVLTMTDGQGEKSACPLSDVTGIAVETNDSGPWGSDVWWMFFGPNGRLNLTFPQGATGEDAVLDRIKKLPGFDHTEMIAAMASTDNSTFIVWQQEGRLAERPID
ncbi:MAG: hypothetical protein JNN10_01655 [Sphingopyxis sp.]|nr:hypothetical protein [Sphingopyxis sp.]